ncbi:MAG: cation:proton antiporter [Ruminococcus sp.]|nr:cation:proton antiporter [Ruminococcus sp.]
MDYDFLISLALILLSTKIFGLMTRHFKLPQVVGALFAGIVIGPACLGFIEKTELISALSELGVIVLIFTVGMETDINELKKSGKASFIIALCGVLVPILVGFAVAKLWGIGESGEGESAILQQFFIGIILTATSVSITVETLKELGKMSTRAGNAILGAALIDDILGIIALTVITSLATRNSESVESDSIWIVLLKILGFFVFAILAAICYHIIFIKWRKHDKKDLRRHTITSFVFCLVLAYIAEKFFGVADITGAFLAGLALSGSPSVKYTTTKFDTISYMLLSPIFFASVGLSITTFKMDSSLIWFTVVIIIVALITKIVGCGLGAKVCNYSGKESLQIGVGMVSRGEVALIVMQKGANLGLIDEKFFVPIIIMVVFTTVVTPILLKVVFNNQDEAQVEDSDIVKKIKGHQEFEEQVQNLSRKR